MLKRAVERVLRALPKPPYGEARYWDQVYAETFRAQGAIEWGTPPLQMLQYQYVDGHGKGAASLRVCARRAGRRQRILDATCATPRLPPSISPPLPLSLSLSLPLHPPRQAPCAMELSPNTRHGMPTC
jgi:hypothetical protein